METKLTDEDRQLLQRLENQWLMPDMMGWPAVA